MSDIVKVMANAMRPYNTEVSPIAIYEVELAIKAIEQAGYAIVPVEPTEAMLDAGERVWSDTTGTTPAAYKAMIEASK